MTTDEECDCPVCSHLRGDHEGRLCKMVEHLAVRTPWQYQVNLIQARQGAGRLD